MSNKYLAQIQLQMVILKKKNKGTIVNVVADRDFIDPIVINHATHFFKKYVYPMLIKD